MTINVPAAPAGGGVPAAPAGGGGPLMPAITLSQAIERRSELMQYIAEFLKEGVDYGVIPGSDRKTLLKPGAEKLCSFFGVTPTFQAIKEVEDWTGADHGGEPFFYYHYRCRLWRELVVDLNGNILSGRLIGEGEGSCNSWEVKYRYRKGERTCPNCGKSAIIRGKPEYERDNRYKFKMANGQIVGPWLCHEKRGGCGQKFTPTDPEIVNQDVGTVKNPDSAELVNTLQKMGQKRSLNTPVLTAFGLSELFTQDMDDLMEEATVVVGEVVSRERNPAPPPPQPERRATEEPPPPDAPPPSTPPSESSEQGDPDPDDPNLQQQGKQAYEQVLKLGLTKEDVADFLRHYLGSPNLREMDALSRLEKLKQILKQEQGQPGAGVRWVIGIAADYRRKIAAAATAHTPTTTTPAATPTLTPPAPTTEAPPNTNGYNLINRYMALCKKVGMKDGMKILNAYLDRQLGSHAVTTCSDPDLQKRFGNVFEALERDFPVGTKLRAFLLGQDQLEVEQ